MDAMIRFEHVTRRFDRKIAVDDLSMEIKRGEVFAFLGPNGAGKTTSLKMLVGLLVPSAGNVLVDGVDVQQAAREAKAMLGFVPDQPELYDKLSGREFLQFVGDIRGLSRRRIEDSITELIGVFQLTEYIDQLTETYSHGMKQRVAFAAALLHDPPALVLDEPMVGLDPHAMRLVKDLLQQRARRGMTVLLSTHTLAIAEQIADRIGVIDNGKLRFVGSVDELQQRLDRRDASLEELFLQIIGEPQQTPSVDPAAYG
jgi:ABC-2 type transport system ATP-binding protein